ncbi:MAG: YbhN family protein [Planctomycetia bacterium]|nr:YbhN family protein [Planctomycetia bacterium]
MPSPLVAIQSFAKNNPLAKRRIITVAKLALLAVVAWFIHGALLHGWESLQENIRTGRWSPAELRWSWLALAAALYSLGQLPCGIFWGRILAGLGQRVPTSAVVRAFYIGHLGKYVPGKAMVVVMRTSMLVVHGAKPALAAVSVFYETFTMMAVGAMVSAVVIVLKYPERTDWLWGSLAMVGITGLPTIPPVFEQIVRRLRSGKGDEATASHELRRIGLATFLSGWGLMTVAWIMMGLSIWATARGAGFTSGRSLAEEWTIGTIAAALSVVIGFLSFIPGGFGVRDGVLFSVLGWIYGNAAAMVTAILVRLVWLVAELAVSIILYQLRTKAAAPPPSSEPSSTSPTHAP